MTAKTKSGDNGEFTGFANADALNSFNSIITATTERGRAMMEAGLQTWTQEAQRFYDELALQGQAALEQLKTCKSPIDLFGVEQAWMAARSKAYMESGKRFAEAFAAVSEGRKPAPPPSSPSV